MKLFRPVFTIILFLFIFMGISNAAANFPYGNFYLSFPVYSDPDPGLGNYYSALSKGVDTALWNPAGIMKISTIEAEATIPLNLGNFHFKKTFQLSDTDFNAGASGLTAGIFFTDDLSDLTKKQELWMPTALTQTAEIRSFLTRRSGSMIILL